jgi:hypothetical protein
MDYCDLAGYHTFKIVIHSHTKNTSILRAVLRAVGCQKTPINGKIKTNLI